MSSVLDIPLFGRPRGEKDNHLISDLVQAIWSFKPNAKEIKLYREVYNAHISVIDQSNFQLCSHADIVSIVFLLRENMQKTLSQLKDELATPYAPRPRWLASSSRDAVARALHFGASLWLMCAVNDWTDDQSLEAFLDNFELSSKLPGMKAVKVNDFHATAEALNRIAGIHIVWTDDLRQHLAYHAKTRQVMIFRHGSFLKKRHDQGYPDKILLEASRTMGLLFPYGESAHGRWNRRVRRKADPDIEAGIACSVPRDLGQYDHWHDRLCVLQDALDTSKPSGLRQLYWDNRDSSQFYTFWFAVLAIVLTLLFGLVQSITGLLQVIKS